MAQRGRTMLATWHFHIEISSKCTLRCPRCARQEVPNSLVNTELDLDFFKHNFTPEFVLANVEKITFCGDDGDPIYAHDLIKVIQYIKSIKPVEIVIVTNGSHKKPEWWQELGSALTDQDTVHFSIDGWDNESNNVYRVNSDFDSILEGIINLRYKSSCKTVWDCIVFKFNEDHLTEIVNTAKSYGLDAVQFTKSTKFGSVYPAYGAEDALEPGSKFVSGTHRFEREQISFTNRINEQHPINFMLYNQVKDNPAIVPLCEIGNKGLYIDAQGRLFPCCWVANRYSHNTEWQLLAERFSLKQRTLTEVVADAFWTTEFKQFRWQECRTKCAKVVVNQDYATNW